MFAEIILTAGTYSILLYYWKQRRKLIVEDSIWYDLFIENHILGSLILWTLLVAYHRAYDSFVTIILIAMMIYGLDRKIVWRLNPAQYRLIALGLILAYILLSLPARGITFMVRIMPEQSLAQWLDIQGGLQTMTLLTFLATALWLLFRINSRYSNDKMVSSVNEI